MNGNSRPELDELLGAYALDAIEPVERFEMEQYLSRNGDARHEVDELRETAALLALLHVQREPLPEHVWDGIQSAILEAAEPAPVPRPEVIALHAEDDEADEISAARRRWSVPLPVAALLVAAASVAIVLLAARHDTSGRGLAAAYRRTAAHSHQVAIVGKTGTLAHVVEAKDGTGYLRADDMPALPDGRVYQLWVIAAGQKAPISAGVLGRHPSAYSSFVFQGHPQAFAVSVENAPGAVAPSTPIGEGAT